MSATKPLLLVHGAWAAAWVWENILPPLLQAGIDVYAPSLPGQLDDRDPDSINLDGYVEFLGNILQQLEQPAVVVGHSGGGMVISQLAEMYPDKIDKLVYLAGMLLPSGINYAEFCEQVLGEGASVGASRVAKLDASGKYSILETDELHDIFYNCTLKEQADQAIARLLPQPLGGWYLVNQLTGERFGSVPKHYVRLGKDNTLLPELQDEMIRLTPVEAVHHIDTDHVPQLSAPQQLVSLLIGLCDG